MVTRWDGENLLVKLTGILRYCCEQIPPTIATPTSRPVLPPGYQRGHYVEEPHVVTDPDPWSQFLANHRLDRARYTLLPTISSVQPWDRLNETDNSILGDQSYGESILQSTYIRPTPVVPQPINIHTVSQTNRAVVNATQRFYDALRVVLHGGVPPSVPTLREGEINGVDVNVAGLPPQLLDSPGHHTTTTHLESEETMSPILQVCAALGILVVIMVILFHTHHFRRDCVSERRAVRRVARRYQVAKAQDIEKNDESTSDVTL